MLETLELLAERLGLPRPGYNISPDGGGGNTQGTSNTNDGGSGSGSSGSGGASGSSAPAPARAAVVMDPAWGPPWLPPEHPLWRVEEGLRHGAPCEVRALRRVPPCFPIEACNLPLRRGFDRPPTIPRPWPYSLQLINVLPALQNPPAYFPCAARTPGSPWHSREAIIPASTPWCASLLNHTATPLRCYPRGARRMRLAAAGDAVPLPVPSTHLRPCAPS